MPKDHPDPKKLGEIVCSGASGIEAVTGLLDGYMPAAVEQINASFGPRRLVKRARLVEPLPGDPRQYSAYRTRIGTMLEYGLSTCLDALIQRDFADRLRLTFAPAHDYPDFIVRDAALAPCVRVEMKAVDAESDEQAARFDVLQGLINPAMDLVLLVGWEWIKVKSNAIDCEFPFIFSWVVVPANDLARERDQSVTIRGGRVDSTGIYVPSKTAKGTLSRDQGNAGKILRLIHQDRRNALDLSQYIQRYLQFVDKVSGRARRP